MIDDINSRPQIYDSVEDLAQSRTANEQMRKFALRVIYLNQEAKNKVSSGVNVLVGSAAIFGPNLYGAFRLGIEGEDPVKKAVAVIWGVTSATFIYFMARQGLQDLYASTEGRNESLALSTALASHIIAESK